MWSRASSRRIHELQAVRWVAAARAPQTHDRVKDFDWEPSYSTPVQHYPTKYKIPGKTRDPFRHLVRDYLSMEQEKDDRQYGGLEDALARGAPARADMGWMEVMKLALPIVSYAEYGALKCQAQLSETVENPELRQGYLFQMQDEIRHINQQLYLARYFARHAADPEGFNNGIKVRNSNVFFRAGRACTEQVIEATGFGLSVAEGWHRGPTADPVLDAGEFDGVIRKLLAAARPNATLDNPQ